MLDTKRIAETPEGVELQLTCAGFYVRSLAWFLDILVQGAVIFILMLFLPTLGNFGMGMLFIAMFLLHWLYPVFFEMLMKGQTPGKKAMNLQVLLIDGTMVNWGASMLRNLLRTVDFLPFFYVLGVITMMLSRDFRRLGDLAANTIVVYKQTLQSNKTIPETAACTPKIYLTTREQQMIVNYAERFHEFSPERAEELALMASPMLDDLNSDKKNSQYKPASHRILSIANYLLGRR